jgi:hypothetical protein
MQNAEMHKTDECSREREREIPVPFFYGSIQHPFKGREPEGAVERCDTARDVLHVTTVL